MLVGLEVQVGGAHVEGVDQHLVEKLDDGSVFDIRLRRFGLFSRCITAQGRFVELEVAADDAVHRLGGALGVGLDEPGQLVELADHPLNTHLGSELHAFGRLMIRRIGRGDDQSSAALAQREDAVAGRKLGIQQIFRQALGIQRVHVQQRR